MSVQVGSRLRGQGSTCEVIVVKGSSVDDTLLCAGTEMVSTAPDETVPQVTDGPAIQLGKRYSDDELGIEVLCTKAGIGPLVFAGHELTIKSAKALPASD